MDPDLTDDQRLLAETTERFIQSEFPLSRVREFADSGGGPLEPSYWRQGADLGWFAGLAPEKLGGGSVSGAGVLDAALLAEIRGGHLQPGNFIDTNVCVLALAAHGTEEQQTKVLPSLIAGDAVASWAADSPTGDWSLSGGIDCRQDGDGFLLSGRKGMVPSASSADWFLVSVEAPMGPTQFLLPPSTPGLSVLPLVALDLTRNFAQLEFDSVEVRPEMIVGVPGQADASIDHQLEIAAVLNAAESVGAMQALFAMTIEYCKDRTAFGRPIGSFQAIKHQLADTSLILEMSHAVATASASAVQAQDRTASSKASMAKAYIADAGIELAHKCWQHFGGISYTWEHDFHLYLRRLTSNAAQYGSATWHRERVCQLNGL